MTDIPGTKNCKLKMVKATNLKVNDVICLNPGYEKLIFALILKKDIKTDKITVLRDDGVLSYFRCLDCQSIKVCDDSEI